MKFNIHKLKKVYKGINSIIKYIPNENKMELIAYFPDAYLPKSVIEAELPYMEIPFNNNEESFYATYIAEDYSTGDTQIIDYYLLSQNDVKEFSQ